MKNNLFVVSFWFLCASPLMSYGEDLVVISNPEIKGEVSSSDVARIYLGKVNQFPDGSPAEPLDVSPSDPNYEKFARKVLKKSPSQLRAYWAKQIFTSRASPPKTRKNQKELRKAVATDKRYLSYIDSGQADDSVRVVLKVE
ncbi:hypothetical protein ACVBEJ_01220 [Porticoccus sp. GXU_MW_L64]